MSRPNSRASQHGRQRMRSSPFPPNELSRVGTPASRGATPGSRPNSRPVSRGQTAKYGELEAPRMHLSKGATWAAFNSPGNRSLNAAMAQSLPGSTRSSTSASRAFAKSSYEAQMPLPDRPATSQDRYRGPIEYSEEEPRPASAPSSHAQRVAQLHYDQFCIRTRGLKSSGATAVLAGSKGLQGLAWTGLRRKASPEAAPMMMSLPAVWRPAQWEVEAEMEDAGVPFNEALASLIIGRGPATALTLECPSSPDSNSKRPDEPWDPFAGANSSSALAGGTLNLKELMAAAGALGQDMLLEHEAKPQVVPRLTAMPGKSSRKPEAARAQAVLTPDRALAAVSVIHGSQSFIAADIRDMGFHEVPDTLRLFSGLVSLSACSNGPLRSLASLRRCGGLRAVDLSDCPELQDLRPLGVLPFLEVVDLSRCVSLQDLRPLLLPERGRDDSPRINGRGAPMSGGWGMHGLRGAVSDRAKPQASGPLGHPALRWLALDGCTGLRWGVGDIPRCGEILYVDLFGCTTVDVSQCLAASQAYGLRTFVWPSSYMLEQVANTEGWSQARREAAAAAATASVADKLASARGRRPSALARLPVLSGPARREALANAVRAACQMGLAPDVTDDELPVETSNVTALASHGQTHSRSHPNLTRSAGSKARQSQGPPGAPRIRPTHFAPALKALGLQVHGVEACHLFRMLDVDGDGGISEQELCALASGPPSQAETDNAIYVLLVRHGGACDAVAADLAGGRAAVDLNRIRECLCVAGIDEALARRVAVALAHCASGLVMQFPGTDVEAALVHALGGYAVARAAELTEDFRAHLRGRFQRCEDAFSVLDGNRTGAVGWEEFQRRLRDALRWPQVSVPGAGEAIFRVLDMEGTGTLSVKAFPALETFEASTTIQAMIAAGRALSRGPTQSLSENLRQLDPVSMGTHSAVTRVEFVSAWEELGDVVGEDVDARIVFGLLDLNGNNCLGREEIAWLVDALPRRAESAAAGALQDSLVARYGTLKDAHAKLLHLDF